MLAASNSSAFLRGACMLPSSGHLLPGARGCFRHSLRRRGAEERIGVETLDVLFIVFLGGT